MSQQDQNAAQNGFESVFQGLAFGHQGFGTARKEFD